MSILFYPVLIVHDKQCKSLNKEVSLDYSNLSDKSGGKPLLIQRNIFTTNVEKANTKINNKSVYIA